MDFLVFHRNRIASLAVFVNVTDDDVVTCIVAPVRRAGLAGDFSENGCGKGLKIVGDRRKKRIKFEYFCTS